VEDELMNFDINQEKIIVNKDGKKIECNVLFTFDSEDTMKSYIGYTDQDIANNGRKNIYISAYNPLKSKIELEDITDERELKMIHHALQQFDNNARG